MKIRPIFTKEANAFVKEIHRHNRPVKLGYLFSIALEDEGKLVGVAIVGRPIARKLDDHQTAEVLRVAVIEGIKNGCSMLYGACKRAAFAMGYTRVITYTLQSESGSSLKASGAKEVTRFDGGSWSRTERVRETQCVQLESKIRWEWRRESKV